MENELDWLNYDLSIARLNEKSAKEFHIPYDKLSLKVKNMEKVKDAAERILVPMKPEEVILYVVDGEKYLRVICPKCCYEHNAYCGTLDYHCGGCGQLLDMSDWRKREEK